MLTMTLAESRTWTRHAAQAFVWARLILEIPKQVEEHAKAASADRAKADQQAKYYPTDPEVLALQAKADRALSVRCEIVTHDPANRRACTTARIVRKAGWQDPEAVVEFALCREGDVKVHCTSVAPARQLPAFVEVRTVSQAREVAAALVRRALEIIDAEE